MALHSFKGSLNNETRSSDPISLNGNNSMLTYLIITNKSNATVTINILIQGVNEDQAHICPLNLQLAQGECYTDRNLVVLDREIIIVSSNGSIDFYFSLVADGNNS